MSLSRRLRIRATLLLALMATLTAASSRLQADCNPNPTPFTDLTGMPSVFCQAVAEAYFSGLAAGTTATTYSPADTVNRQQMAAFITRTLDQSLKRGSSRAALGQWWTTTPHFDVNLGTTAVGAGPRLAQTDGVDVWVANFSGGSVSRVRASDGKLLDTWTGATNARSVLVAMGRVFVVGGGATGLLYMIDPAQAAGAVTTAANTLGANPRGIAFDGNKIWTANLGASISIITPGATLPWSATNVSTGFTGPIGIIYDGANIWVTDEAVGKLFKLDSSGAIISTVTVGTSPRFPVFDGTNIWVPNSGSNSISVVRASTAVVIATLQGNGLNGPFQAAFDGERVLVTNQLSNSVSLWKAADLSPLGTLTTGAATAPTGVCSDGVNFWITLRDANKLARF